MVRFVNGVPQALYLSAHSGGAAYEYNVVPSLNGRAITYIGLGTHANYASPGTHEHDFPGLDDETDAGALWDVTKNFRGFWFDNDTQTFSLASGAGQGAADQVSEGAGWLQFQGRWGDKQYNLFHDGQYCVGIPDVATECLLVDGPTGRLGYHFINEYGSLTTSFLSGPIAKNLGRSAVCQDESDCTVNASV